MNESSAFLVPELEDDCLVLDDFLIEHMWDVTAFISTRLIFGFAYSIVFLFGVVGNVLVLTAVARNRSLQIVRNMFIVNLSISDLLVCILCLPISVYVNMAKQWNFGTVLCHIIPAMQGSSVIISTFTLTCIAVDRFILICLSGTVAWIRPITKLVAIVMITSVWSFAIALCIPIAINSEQVPGSYYNDTNQPFCGYFCDEIGWLDRPQLRKFYGFTLLLVQFVLPLILITVCYGCIIAKVRRSIVKRHGMHQSSGSNAALTLRDRWSSMKNNILKLRTSCTSHFCSCLGRSATLEPTSGRASCQTLDETLTSPNLNCNNSHNIITTDGNNLSNNHKTSDNTLQAANDKQTLEPRNSDMASHVTVTSRQSADARRQRTNRMQTAMVLLFAASWFPSVTLNILNDFGIETWVQSQQPYLVSTIVHLISMTSTCWNPFLYAYLNTGFRNAFLDIAAILHLASSTKQRTRNALSKISVRSRLTSRTVQPGTTLSVPGTPNGRHGKSVSNNYLTPRSGEISPVSTCPSDISGRAELGHAQFNSEPPMDTIFKQTIVNDEKNSLLQVTQL